MQLELISHSAKQPRTAAPLVFIHGIFCCAGIWEPYFLPFFAKHGYHAHALSLRGHGASDGKQALTTTRLRDYVDDVAKIADQFDTPPVLIGASMGGVIVQHYLRHHPASGAVLLGSGPPYGMMTNSLWMMASNPLLATQLSMMSLFGTGMISIETARQALFRPDTPDQYIRQFMRYAQPESPLAMMDMLGWDLPPSRQTGNVPALVLGAEHDAFVTPASVHETARAFGTTAEIFPDIAHGMMLDPQWRQVAERIQVWLDAILIENSLN